jgi:hypothetical protein
MRLGATILWALLASIAGAGLFLLKSEVQTREERLAHLEQEIADSQNNIHVLEAEWSYLNGTGRLRDAATRLLDLHPIKPSQLATLDALPMNDPPQPQPTLPPALPPISSIPHTRGAAVALRTPQ